MLEPKRLRLAAVMGLLLAGHATPALAVAAKTAKPKTTKTVTKAANKSVQAAPVKKKSKSRRYRVRRVYNPWDTPTYADSTWADSIDGEDLTVRRAAVQALGPYNGSVLVVDTSTGRILTIVNQRLALMNSYQPCSTIKLYTSLAALAEGLIDKETVIRLSRRERMNLTVALAHSNNPFFGKLGDALGYDRVYHYGKMFGLGERAGLSIAGEIPGSFPVERPKGLKTGIMTSYGEGISMTVLQLGAFVSAIANGGTLYYLQYPMNQEQVATFEPVVKRRLDTVRPWMEELKPGMAGSVDFGSGRRAALSYNEPLLGKTGTCTDGRTHLGWFAAYNEIGPSRLAVVVLMTGGAPVKGPVAAGIVGQVFKNLEDNQYFARHTPLDTLTSLPAAPAPVSPAVTMAPGAAQER